MKLAALMTALVAGVLGVASTILLTRGTDPIPWAIQSYSGQSEAEKAHRSKARRWFIAGLICLGLAFAVSACSAIFSYFS
jgi:hypothetical protein